MHENCPDCHGAGRKAGERCTTCQGMGFVSLQEALEFVRSDTQSNEEHRD